MGIFFFLVDIKQLFGGFLALITNTSTAAGGEEHSHTGGALGELWAPQKCPEQELKGFSWTLLMV